MKLNRSNYALIKKMGIQTINLPNGGTYQALYRKNIPEGKGSIVLPMRRMFPAIYAAHQQVGHMKIVSRYKNLSKIVYNHTREQSKIFIETCPACIERAPVIKPLKGAAVAIKFVKFRERMQVDLLIDFRKHAKKDQMGNLK
jgi:hypothetical protein